MDVKPTISALNKFTADIKELREQLENTTAAADPQEITPQQLVQALNILTEAYNHMDSELFIKSIYPSATSTQKWYWLDAFDKMRNFGWCNLWNTVDGQQRDLYAAGILKFFKQYKAGKAHKIKLTGNMREAEEC